jgi:hypothetical protein
MPQILSLNQGRSFAYNFGYRVSYSIGRAIQKSPDRDEMFIVSGGFVA